MLEQISLTNVELQMNEAINSIIPTHEKELILSDNHKVKWSPGNKGVNPFTPGLAIWPNDRHWKRFFVQGVKYKIL